CQQSNEDPPTF
nr:immunoglobulin light chain junction region [Mus musculus]NSL97199.1 immunoglobulin light chain junction region [Mus musculus]NSL98394.1 immunoglobulin light chain junction region [Mus musculus]NSM00937.1 immunoglobulin light chain junction region [Mus musculus]